MSESPGEKCAGCGREVSGGTAGCQALFEELGARNLGDPAYGRFHRMLVDAYCLQHPDRYCVSAKSLAAHLCGLCCALERKGSASVHRAVQQWLSGKSPVEKPKLPKTRGALMIEEVHRASGAEAYGRAVERWARATWEAYSELHALARQWIEAALARH